MRCDCERQTEGEKKRASSPPPAFHLSNVSDDPPDLQSYELALSLAESAIKEPQRAGGKCARVGAVGGQCCWLTSGCNRGCTRCLLEGGGCHALR